MAPIDVVQAQSQAATQQQNLVAAQATMRTAELALKRLIVGGTQDPNWNVQLDPIDRPDFRAEPIDIEAAVRRALSERTDLEIAKKNIAGQRRHAEVPRRSDAAAGRPRRRPTAWSGLGGIAVHLRPGTTGVNRVADRHHPRRLRRRAVARCSATHYPALDRRS